MSAQTSIQWTDRTWNPVRGCSVISPGCANCYAMKQAHRFSGPGKAYEGLTTFHETRGPQWTGVVRTVESALLEPLSWRKPARVFVNSMSDLFHEDVPFEFVDRVFAVMALATKHTFQVLTKRPERMRAYLDGDVEDLITRWADAAITIAPLRDGSTDEAADRYEDVAAVDWPLKNVWLGVSVENQHFADERIPLLLQTPAAVRFISAEPLLGPVDLRRWIRHGGCGSSHEPIDTACKTFERGANGQCVYCDHAESCHPGPGAMCDIGGGEGGDWSYRGLNWVIVGGESGPGARPFDIEWARSIVSQCKAAGVACFVKQVGSRPHGWWTNGNGPMFNRHALRDRKGGDMAEWPADLQVREFPA